MVGVSARALISLKLLEFLSRDIASLLTDCHGVSSLFGHPRSISSPIVQVHVVVWKGEAAELWVKRCALLLAMSRGRNIASEGTTTWSAELPVKLTYLTVRIP